jgi:pimeloyl-ACP methyl ester carboxylesterase
MGDLTPPDYLANRSGVRLAYRLTEGCGPGLVLLPGYASDMTGDKAVALEGWARTRGRACLRFDYAGCGESEGNFEDGTVEGWRDDAIDLIDALTQGPQILVGSSMGGWIMLLAALARPDRVQGLVGIAAAPDFTQWGFTPDQFAEIEAKGVLEKYSPYSPEPMRTYRGFIESGNRCLITGGEIAVNCPVRLLHGQRDPSVSWERSPRLAAMLRSDDVQVILVKDGDHRLSREQDIALLIRTVEALTESA